MPEAVDYPPGVASPLLPGSISTKPAIDIRLYRQRASYEFAAARDILRLAPIAHIAFLHPGDDYFVADAVVGANASHATNGKGPRGPTVMNEPLITVVMLEDGADGAGDEEDSDNWAVYLHSHRHSGVVEAIERGTTTLTASTFIVDGLVLSPTAHDHSLNYRSATLHLTSPRVLDTAAEHAEKSKSLAAVTDIVTGYSRTGTVGQPTEPSVRRTTVVKCKLAGVSCKQRIGGWAGGKAPALDGDEGRGFGFKGVVPCWTQFGTPVGYGRDGDEVATVLNSRSEQAREHAENAAWARDEAKISGLGVKRSSSNRA